MDRLRKRRNAVVESLIYDSPTPAKRLATDELVSQRLSAMHLEPKSPMLNHAPLTPATVQDCLDESSEEDEDYNGIMVDAEAVRSLQQVAQDPILDRLMREERERHERTCTEIVPWVPPPPAVRKALKTIGKSKLASDAAMSNGVDFDEDTMELDPKDADVILTDASKLGVIPLTYEKINTASQSSDISMDSEPISDVGDEMTQSINRFADLPQPMSAQQLPSQPMSSQQLPTQPMSIVIPPNATPHNSPITAHQAHFFVGDNPPTLPPNPVLVPNPACPVFQTQILQPGSFHNGAANSTVQSRASHSDSSRFGSADASNFWTNTSGRAFFGP